MNIKDIIPNQTRIRFHDPMSGGAWHNQVGTVIKLERRYVWVRYDHKIGGRDEWKTMIDEHGNVPFMPLDPEEVARIEDQRRREEHADKWL